MAIEFNNVGMIQAIVDLEFCGELLLHVIVTDSGFEYLLNCAYKTSDFMHTEINVSEFA
jgi:hypothetical protein